MKILGPLFTRCITSDLLRNARRSAFSLVRKQAVVHYFHQIDDPYGALLLPLLAQLASQYQVVFQLHCVPAPEDAATPDRARLNAWALRDAEQLRSRLNLAPFVALSPPVGMLKQQGLSALVCVLKKGGDLNTAASICNAVWSGDEASIEAQPKACAADVDQSIRAGERMRNRLKGYLASSLWFEGEWYWGVDRLPYLLQRLQYQGLGQGADTSFNWAVPDVVMNQHGSLDPPKTKASLTFYGSLRSPYTALCIERLRYLVQRYQVDLNIRPLLPMVMRGLKVPLKKRLYILMDAKREAQRLGLAFGTVADPVGLPVERGLAVWHAAIEKGVGLAFAESFLQGVFAQGIDAGSDAGLNLIAQRSGLDAKTVAAALADDAWRKRVAENRDALLAAGLWGVPVFQVDGFPAQWGQDRLWLIEEQLRTLCDENHEAS